MATLTLDEFLLARILSPGDTLDGGDVLPGFSVAVDDIFRQMAD